MSASWQARIAGGPVGAPLCPPGPAGEVVELEQDGAFWVKAFISEPNCRVQVLDYRVQDPGALRRVLEQLAAARRLTKVFLKARASEGALLVSAGFVEEARIRGYHDGQDAAVLSLFLSEERRQSSAGAQEAAALATLQEAPVPQRSLKLPARYRCTVARPADAPALAALYQEVFASYPYPIFDPAYLMHTMQTNIVYRLIHDGGDQLVAAASGETMPRLRSAEMTDFATLPSQRGKRLALYLLQELEKDMAARGIPNLYTLARSSMMGMNKVFHHLGYSYTGTLVKNCHIGGAFEDMICWCKTLAR